MRTLESEGPRTRQRKLSGKSNWHSRHQQPTIIPLRQVKEARILQLGNALIHFMLYTHLPLGHPMVVLWFSCSLQNLARCKLLAKKIWAHSHQPQNAMYHSNLGIICNRIFGNWKHSMQILQLRPCEMILHHQQLNSQVVQLTIFACTPSWLCSTLMLLNFANNVQIFSRFLLADCIGGMQFTIYSAQELFKG
jgi:hypothetical protein